MIIQKIEKNGSDVTIYIDIPGQQAGLSKLDIMNMFVRELDENILSISDCIGGSLSVSGRMTTDMALMIGIVSQRLGSKRVSLFDPVENKFNDVAGGESDVEMTTQLLPGMVVEFRGNGMFKDGARGIVMNVGKDSVNIADKNSTSRSRRDTAWTRNENVFPVSWEFPPKLKK